jgi:tRNA 2-thiocytidine biosynthesis protein TtcA
MKDVNRAVREFGMIAAGDRIAVAVSGGKDSLALLSLLQLSRHQAQEPYELMAIHVCGDARGITPVHEPLAAWLAAQEDIAYRIVEPGIGADEARPLTCQRCTWLRRKSLFETAEQMGCNVVAYAHHADDAAQTTLLNMLYGGAAWTLRPRAEYFGNRFRLIRPLFYVPESELRRFARAGGFPPPPPDCPRAGSSRRKLIKEMLGLLGQDYLRHARTNLIRAGLRGSHVY